MLHEYSDIRYHSKQKTQKIDSSLGGNSSIFKYKVFKRNSEDMNPQRTQFLISIDKLGGCPPSYIQNIVLNLKIIKREMSSRQIEELQTTEVAGFIAKTFQILNNQQFIKIAYWAPSGSEFIIKDINKFQTIVLPRYFRHSKMNSFIRQLNMYGFHKSRADHSKSVFSHPNFLKNRQDLLILIKRKIKGKTEQKNQTVPQTPIKKHHQVEVETTAKKKTAETGQELGSEQQLVEIPNNVSFNLLGTKERLGSLLNLNFTVNRLPLAELGAVVYDEPDDSASIADKIEFQEWQKEDKKQDKGSGTSFKFMNPSCFFDSMKKSL